MADRGHVRRQLVDEGGALQAGRDQEGPRRRHDHGHLAPGLQRRHHSLEKGKEKFSHFFHIKIEL